MNDTIKLVRQLQPQVAQWSLENFGTQSYHNPLGVIGVGIGDLCAELENTPTDKQTVADAIGNIMIAMMDFCSRYHINLAYLMERMGSPGQDLFPAMPHESRWTGLTIHYGAVLRGAVERDQGLGRPRWVGLYGGLYGLVRGLLRCSPIPLETATREAWARASRQAIESPVSAAATTEP